MKQIILILIAAIFITVPVFSNPEHHEVPSIIHSICQSIIHSIIPEYSSVTYIASNDNDVVIPEGLRNNRYYIESLRLQKLAKETYDHGDYEASANFSQEAIRNAELSDKYIADQLMPEAKRLLDWADANNIETRFPNNYNEGLSQYETAAEAHANESWNESIIAAVKTIEVFGALEGGTTTTVVRPTTTETPSSSGKARQYTVRSWIVEKDCLWNIAGYSWVYGDPWKWKILYEANKSRMPDPNNPNLIEPGMILEIPSLEGEARQGMYHP